MGETNARFKSVLFLDLKGKTEGGKREAGGDEQKQKKVLFTRRKQDSKKEKWLTYICCQKDPTHILPGGGKGKIKPHERMIWFLPFFFRVFYFHFPYFLFPLRSSLFEFSKMLCVCHRQNGGCSNPVNVINFLELLQNVGTFCFHTFDENVFTYVLFIYLSIYYLFICYVLVKLCFLLSPKVGDW